MIKSEEEIIQQEIEIDPHRPGPANVRLRRSGAHVWAVIGYFLYAVNGDEQALARDYELSTEEVRAALLYYRRHRSEIDGRLADSQPVVPG